MSRISKESPFILHGTLTRRLLTSGQKHSGLVDEVDEPSEFANNKGGEEIPAMFSGGWASSHAIFHDQLASLPSDLVSSPIVTWEPLQENLYYGAS